MKQGIPKPPRAASASPQRIEALARTKSGVEFDPAAGRWAYQDGVSNVVLDFAGLKGLSGEMLDSAKSTFKWYAMYRSSDHLENLFTRLQHFIRAIAPDGQVLSSISATDLINYRSRLLGSTAWYLGALSGFLKKWHQLGYPGIEADAMLLLSQLRLKGNAKGVAVLTMDPNEGPYTHIEAEALQAALNSAYAVGQVGTADYVIVWLYMLLGQRNKQYASLKVCDAAVKRDSEGNLSYSVMMPSAKKGLDRARQRLVERPLIEQFGEVLVGYA